jgi:protein gp37
MGKSTGIEWCDATFNPIRGCSKVSPACKNCYAMELVNRFGGDFLGRRVVAAEKYWKDPLKWNEQARKSGTRVRVFCASLADVFESWDGPIHDHNGTQLYKHPFGWTDVESNMPLTMDDVRGRLFDLFDATLNLDWLLLTKRPENILKMWPTWPKGFPSDGSGGHGSGSRYLKNVWIGTTVENQEQADKRIPELLKCRDLSPVLFLSCEPLLGPVDLDRESMSFCNVEGSLVNGECEHSLCRPRTYLDYIDWIIVGGESGKDARPMNPAWAESLRDQCEAAGVPFFFKQWGEWIPGTNFGRDDGNYNETAIGVFPESKYETHLWDEDNRQHEELVSVKVGKKRAGRLLDGKEFSQFPCTEASK